MVYDFICYINTHMVERPDQEFNFFRHFPFQPAQVTSLLTATILPVTLWISISVRRKLGIVCASVRFTFTPFRMCLTITSTVEMFSTAFTCNVCSF